MTAFIRYLTSCRESHYANVWEAKSGNILTRSKVSEEQAIRLHIKKLQNMGYENIKIVKRS